MSRAPDAYEEKYMAGEGAVLYRDKTHAPKLLSALLGVGTVAGIVGALAGGAPWFAAPLVAVAGLFGFSTLAALRTSVSRRAVHIQYGLFGPKIPVDDIESVEVVSYNWMTYGGWGIRRGIDGSWAFNMMGDQGRAVKIRYRARFGSRTVLVSARSPDALAEAIATARASTTSASALDEARAAHGVRAALATDAVGRDLVVEEAQPAATRADD